MNKFKINQNNLFYIFVIFIAIATRIYWARLGFSIDDLFTMRLARQSVSFEVLWEWHNWDNNPLGLYLLYWIINMVIPLTHPVAVLLPLIVGLLSIFEFKKLSKFILNENFSQKLVFILFCFSFSTTYYSSEIRAYIFALFLSLRLLNFIIGLKSYSNKNCILFAIYMTLLAYFHFMSLPLIASILIIWALENRSKDHLKFLLKSSLLFVIFIHSRIDSP